MKPKIKRDMPAMKKLLKRELALKRANREYKAYIVGIPHKGGKIIYHNQIDNWCYRYMAEDCDYDHEDDAYGDGINYGADLTEADTHDIFIISNGHAWRIYIDRNDNYNPEMTLDMRPKYIRLKQKGSQK